METTMNHIWAIIPAAGLGTRMGTKVKKQFLKLDDGEEIFIHTLRVFENSDEIEGILLVCSHDDLALVKDILNQYSLKKIAAVIDGGATRQLSVYEGLRALPEECDLVAIHDGVRPFLSAECLHDVLADAGKYGASVLGVSVKDTIKKADEDGFVAETLDRRLVFSIQTPQVFNRKLIVEAHNKAYTLGDILCTDDAQVVEKYMNTPVHICPGSYSNIKITTPEDLKR